MFIVEKVNDNRIDLDVSGKIDSEAMKKGLEVFIQKSQEMNKAKMLYRLRDFDFPTFGAIGVELSRLPELFRAMRKFEKAAVLCDTVWIQKVSEFEGLMFPWLTIKAFNYDQEQQAVAWLEGS